MIRVIWEGAGLYVPHRVGFGWEWRWWTDAQPPIAGTYLESEEAARRIEQR